MFDCQVRNARRATWVTVDITAYVKAQGTDKLSLALFAASNNGLSIDSTEGDRNAPQLVINFSP